MDSLVGIPWQGLGWGGLIFLSVLLVIRGDLVPRKIHEEMRNDRDKWRESSERKDETIRLLAQSSTTAAAALEALERAAHEGAKPS